MRSARARAHTRTHNCPQVRAAREESALRIRTLEDALGRLTNARGASEAAVEAARGVAETDKAKRAEARARADVEHLKVWLGVQASWRRGVGAGRLPGGKV